MPPPSDIRTLIWEETLAADMRRRYFQALAANAASLNAGLRAALPLTTVITFLSAAGVFLTQWTIPLSVRTLQLTRRRFRSRAGNPKQSYLDPLTRLAE